MPAKVTPIIFLYMFLGGAIGAPLRYLVELSIPAGEFKDLLMTTAVNLTGTLALGLVNSSPLFDNLNSKMFFGHGLLGGYTTMSGLAVITASLGMGIGENAFWYWGFALAQLIAGLVSYQLGLWLGRSGVRR